MRAWASRTVLAARGLRGTSSSSAASPGRRLSRGVSEKCLGVPPPRRRSSSLIAPSSSSSLSSPPSRPSAGLIARQRFCEEAVREAGAVARRYFEGGVEVLEKTGPQDLLSVADKECEGLLVARLSGEFPGDGVQGEEGASREADGVWVIDPIDGTNNFVRGDPMWCVSVSYNVGDTTEVGVIYDVMADHLFSAVRGGGATLNGSKPLAVSTRHGGDLSRAMVCVGTSTQAPRACFAGLMRSLADTGCGLRFGGSTALALCYVASGRWDAYYEYGTNTWDALAGNLLVAEAGGRVSPFPVRDAQGRIETRRHKTYAAAPDLYEALDAHIEASRRLA